MKYNLLLLLLLNNLFGFPPSSAAQEQVVYVQGRVKCTTTSSQSTKGAVPVLVLPDCNPTKAVRTNNEPSGYYLFSTGLTLNDVVDKSLRVSLLSRCGSCAGMTKTIFISESKLFKKDANGLVYNLNWFLPRRCDSVELKSNQADSLEQLLIKIKPQRLSTIRSSSVIGGTPALLSFLQSAVLAGPTVGLGNIRYGAQQLGEGDMIYGQLLPAYLMYFGTNRGFNFSPSRDLSEALLTNAAALGFSPKKNQLHIISNWRNNIRMTASTEIHQHWKLGLHALALKQDEFRSINFEDPNGPFTREEDSIRLQNLEAQIGVSGIYRNHSSLSFGGSLKMVFQHFDVPDSLICDVNGNGTFESTTYRRALLDIDLSLAYKPGPNLQLGASLFNVSQRSLFADTYTPWQSTRFIRRQACIGLGATYKYQRLHAGVDLLLTAYGFYDLAVGINVVPFNQALLSAGLSVRRMSPSISFQYGHFKMAYVNDRDWVVNETSKPKAALFNGRIYSGLIFAF